MVYLQLIYLIELRELVELGKLIEHSHLLRAKDRIQTCIIGCILQQRWRDLGRGKKYKYREQVIQAILDLK